ncbi:MAG: carboxypeptidase-like regulatory domain-containing protein [Bacteroidota bacterium]|nr:carboxypeptidase-like regulatory domain-containing protein [Bacteroidota bacterium]
MKVRSVLLICILIFASCMARANNTSPGNGEETNKKSDILGVVIQSETRKPLSNVSITAYSSSRKEKIVVTNERGQYNFDDLKGGTYKLVFEKDGFKKVTRDKVVIRTDEAVQIDILMEEHVTFDFMPGPFNFLISND